MVKKTILPKLIHFITYKKQEKPQEFVIPTASNFEEGVDDSPATKRDNKISRRIQENIEYIKATFNALDNKDIVIREFLVSGEYKAFIAFLDGMVDRTVVNDFILRPLLDSKQSAGNQTDCKLSFLLEKVLEINQAKEIRDHKEAIYEILSGNTILYVNGCDYYITNETKGFDRRSVETPQIEGAVSGSQEAFNETLRTNITLIRKNIKNPNLINEYIRVGSKNQILCAVVYMKGLTNPAIVEEVKRRLSNIKVEYVAGDGFIDQYLEDNPYSLLPTILQTERPDKTVSHLMEGRVAILVDGVPFVKIVPVTFISFLHSPEDSFNRWQYGTFIRLLRFAALFGAMLLPGFYVAVTNYHHEMIPTELLIAIATAKENVPFPTLVEVVLMELSFELIREAGIRVPGIIGNTLGIIGALILGQAAVQASIVSPILIIVVAVTGLSNFAIPNFSFAFGVRILRFVFIAAGALLGFYGITIAWLVMLCLMLNIKTFGVDFFAPIAPVTAKGKDFVLRYPLFKEEVRPDYLNPLDQTRQPEKSRVWVRNQKNGYKRRGNND